MRQKNIGMNATPPVRPVMVMAQKIDKDVSNVKSIIIWLIIY